MAKESKSPIYAIHESQLARDYRHSAKLILQFQQFSDFWQSYDRMLRDEYSDDISQQYWHFKEAVYTVAQNSPKDIGGHDKAKIKPSPTLSDLLDQMNDSVGRGVLASPKTLTYFDPQKTQPKTGTVARYEKTNRHKFIDIRRWRITQNPRTLHFLGVRRKYPPED